MKDKLVALLLYVAIVAMIPGCTRANKTADMAHQLAAKQTDTIVYDLSGISRQLTIDKFALAARNAASRGDADAAAAAVTGAITEYDKITWLAREEYRKAREVNNLARFYILSRRGWNTVLYKQWEEAKAEVEAKAKQQDDQKNHTEDTPTN